MNKLFSISALAAAAAALAFTGSATAADMPTKAAALPPAPVIYDWSGLYVGFNEGYRWASVQDTTPAFTQAESKVRNGVVGFHVGLQKQFAYTGWGSWVIGAEGSLNEPVKENDVGNFTSCANPAFACGLRNIKDNWSAGGRLGLAFNLPVGGWLFGGDYLLTAVGGWTTATFQRADFLLVTGVLNAGGGQSLARHDGYYVGGGLEHMVAKGNLVDYIVGFDYQHQFFGNQGDLDANGVVHTMSADVDIVRLRTTLKFK
jgi:outer membrane immunogenic protein